MSEDKVVDYKEKVKEIAHRQAAGYRDAFSRTGEKFTKKHFNMSVSEFIEYVRRERKYPPVKVPFTPFGETAIPDLSLEIWEQMERSPVWKEMLEEDPFAFLIELGKRFNKKLEES